MSIQGISDMNARLLVDIPLPTNVILKSLKHSEL